MKRYVLIPNIKPIEETKETVVNMATFLHAKEPCQCADCSYSEYYRNKKIGVFMGDCISYVSQHPHVCLESGWEADPVITQIISMCDNPEIVVYVDSQEPTPEEPPILEE